MEHSPETLPVGHPQSPGARRLALGRALGSVLPAVPPPCLRQEPQGLREPGLQPRCCLRGASGCGGAVSGVPGGIGLGVPSPGAGLLLPPCRGWELGKTAGARLATGLCVSERAGMLLAPLEH